MSIHADELSQHNVYQCFLIAIDSDLYPHQPSHPPVPLPPAPLLDALLAAASPEAHPAIIPHSAPWQPAVAADAASLMAGVAPFLSALTAKGDS
jgi:hypothetical protein